MTNKELLSAAGMAAGISGNWREFPGRPERFITENYKTWDPLSNDGDALRLSAALGINVIYGRDGETFTVNAGGFLTGLKEGESLIDATRRAIVSAAAEIGRAMR
ncbi:MAG: hypothetical protein ACRES5_13120 [Pseudomonas sp.]